MIAVLTEGSQLRGHTAHPLKSWMVLRPLASLYCVCVSHKLFRLVLADVLPKRLTDDVREGYAPDLGFGSQRPMKGARQFAFYGFFAHGPDCFRFVQTVQAEFSGIFRSFTCRKEQQRGVGREGPRGLNWPHLCIRFPRRSLSHDHRRNQTTHLPPARFAEPRLSQFLHSGGCPQARMRSQQRPQAPGHRRCSLRAPWRVCRWSGTELYQRAFQSFALHRGPRCCLCLCLACPKMYTNP